MGVFDRLATITKANINKVLDAMEGDGEAVMEQTLVDAKVEYANQKRAVAEVLADYNRYKEQYEKKIVEADTYHTYAQNALRQGNEQDAIKNLEIEKRKRDEATAIQARLQKAYNDSERAKKNLRVMQEQITEADDTMRDVKRLNRVAGSSEVANAGVVSDESLRKFDKFAKKAQERYDMGLAMEELSESEDVDDEKEMAEKYGKQVSMSEDLEKLKAEIGI